MGGDGGDDGSSSISSSSSGGGGGSSSKSSDGRTSEKVVVFAYNRSVCQLLKDRLTDAGIGSNLFWGGTSNFT